MQTKQQVKQAYDREHTAKLYKQFLERKERLANSKFDGECFLCGIKGWSGMHLHHTDYDPIESNYPRNSKTMSVRWKRPKEAETHPERFKMLCERCHYRVEGIKKLMSAFDLNKLVEVL